MMSDFFNLDAVDLYTYQILVIDLAIAVVMISALRFLTGLVANVASAEELSSRDNYAFGIAMAGGTISLALMLTGAVSGTAGDTYIAELISVGSYGVLGMILIKVGRLAQDKLVLRGIPIQQEIKNGNVAAGIVDAASTVAIGLVLRAVMLWVESDTLSGLLVVLAAFVITLVVLGLVTTYRQLVYARRHGGQSLQSAYQGGNVALAIRYFGHILGVALALTAASGVVAYQADNLPLALGTWFGVTLIFSSLVSLLSVIARRVILFGVDVVEEVDRQGNIGVATIEAAIYISVGLFFTALFV
jgi:uncharacterized membrane protein YjfL (UPF0719 family)